MNLNTIGTDVNSLNGMTDIGFQERKENMVTVRRNCLDELLDTRVVAVIEHTDELSQDKVIKAGQTWHIIGYDDDWRILVEREGVEVYLSFFKFSTIFSSKK